MSQPPAERAVDAQRRNERAAIIAGRAITSIQLIASLGSLRRQVVHRKVLSVGIPVLLAQSALAGLRLWVKGRPDEPILGWSDVVVSAGALAIEAASWGSRDFPPDPRWSLPFSVVVSSWAPFELDDRALPAAGTLWALTYLTTTCDQSPSRSAGTVAGQRLGELFVAPVCGAVCRRFARHLRRQAEQLDIASEDAIDRADALSEERERESQFRVAHDSAVQVLEAVAGGWNLELEALEGRIDLEIARLERVLAGGPLIAGASLRDMLGSLADEFRLMGLNVRVDVDPQADLVSAERVFRAASEATREALVNVRKHSGVNDALITVKAVGGGIEVAIHDGGRGFDVSAPTAGFGLQGSLRQRLAAVGGTVELRSQPGTGTTVVITAPATR